MLYTTPAMLETESAIITSVNRGMGAHDKGAVDEAALKALPDFLTAPQRQAAAMILTTKDRFVAVPGFAGTGKSTLWTAVQSVLEAQGSPLKILGLAPTHPAVQGLKEKGLTAQTLQSFLLDNQVFSNLLIFILRLIAKINDLRGVDVKTVRIHQKT